ncbi:MAG: DUF1799 domain-containing protein [Nitrosomonas sp.]|nr:DUF1799 domain-containing protein [Nitrosomonas sp.]
MEAARYWAARPAAQPADPRAADPEEWQQLIEDSEAEQEDEYFAVWPENWKTLQIFLSLGNSFAVDGLSGRFSGIPRSDIESTLTMHNIRPTKRRSILQDLIAMESAALEVLNRK